MTFAEVPISFLYQQADGRIVAVEVGRVAGAMLRFPEAVICYCTDREVMDGVAADSLELFARGLRRALTASASSAPSSGP